MRPYFELTALPPEAFLKPESFVTEYDGRDPNRAEEQYREGLRRSAEYGRITIPANSTWAAEEGAYDPVTRVRSWGAYSYEGIGYHAHTSSLLRGFLDGPAPIDVERRMPNGTVRTTRIKESGK
ncbi:MULTISPECIES: hypothetical protein [Streptomyces]|uniref:Uncharacterized protein n=2 Tax=Streptomyces TaxID=1883 RepID=A0ABV9IK34_9ACTN